jgi:two-component system response regulator (stage 0 sporulation protein F)
MSTDAPQPLAAILSAEGTEKRGSVLLVDDDDTLRDVLAGFLRSEGFDVIEACDGLECLSLLQSGLKPDAMLLDYRMPGLSGAQVFERLKSGGLGEAVVMMTAATAAPELARKHGFLHVLTKPFGVEDLLAIVDRVVGSSGRGSSTDN